PLGDELADPAGLGGLVAVQRAQVRLHGRRRDHGVAAGVVDDLDEDVTRGAGDHQAGTLGGADDLLAQAQVPALARGVLALGALDDHCHGLLTSLSDLAADLFALVAHTLGLVRVGLAQLAQVRGDLTDLLLVDTAHREPGGRLDLEGDALRRRDGDRVGVAQGELEVRALGHDAVPGAVDLQALGVAVHDALDHVGQQSAGQTVQGTGLALVVRAGHLQRPFLATVHRDRLCHPVGELALGALYGDGP